MHGAANTEILQQVPTSTEELRRQVELCSHCKEQLPVLRNKIQPVHEQFATLRDLQGMNPVYHAQSAARLLQLLSKHSTRNLCITTEVQQQSVLAVYRCICYCAAWHHSTDNVFTVASIMPQKIERSTT